MAILPCHHLAVSSGSGAAVRAQVVVDRVRPVETGAGGGAAVLVVLLGLLDELVLADVVEVDQDVGDAAHPAADQGQGVLVERDHHRDELELEKSRS